MLAREDSTEFFATVKYLLEKAHSKLTYEESLARDDDATADDKTDLSEDLESRRKKHDKSEIANVSILRSSLYAFMGNLCLDKSLRVKFANDQGGILS